MYIPEDTGWLTLKDMPVGLSFATGTVHESLIFLTGFNVNFILKFHPRLYTFDMLESPLEANSYKTLVSSVKALVVLGYEMS